MFVRKTLTLIKFITDFVSMLSILLVFIHEMGVGVWAEVNGRELTRLYRPIYGLC